jgi:Tol biopolymer transport system component
VKRVLVGAALAFGLSLTIPGQDQETRFDVKTPPTTEAATLGISPDGDKIFFVADREGKYELWVHSLSSGTARPLPTRDFEQPTPCWSPDSRSIAFFDFYDFQRIDLESGAVRTLVSFRSPTTGGGTSGRGCTWNRDRTILYALATERPIFRISDEGETPGAMALQRVDGRAIESDPLLRQCAAGTGVSCGPPGSVTPPDPVYYAYPHFLPDGQHFLFFSRGQVQVGELNGAAPRKLLDASVPAIYSPSGHLLFIRVRTLYAQRFDPREQRLDGDPFTVAEQAAAVSISAAGHLVYRTGPGGSLRQFKWFDRAGNETGTVGELLPLGGAAPELSPDGKTVAFQNIGGDILLMDTSSGKLTPFMTDLANESWPVWSPDGQTIYFSSNRTGEYELYEKPVSGSVSEKLVLDSAAFRLARQVSPDGRFLLFKQDGDIFAVQLDGNPPGVLPVIQSPNTDDAPQFAPDGKWIAYQEVDQNQRSEIYLRQFPTGRRVRVSGSGGVHPRWRPDGKELFYIALNRQLMAVPIELSPNGQEPQVGTPVGLFTLPIRSNLTSSLFMQQYTVSRDGQRFLVAAIPNLDYPIHVIRNWKPQK